MSTHPNRPEAQAKLRLVGGDEPPSHALLADFDALFHRFSPYVATIGLRILGRDDELDDLVQEVFFEAHRGLDSLRDPGAIKGWLARITVRRATRRLRLRKLRRWLGFEPLVEESAELTGPDASPEQAAVVKAAYRVLDRLSAQERVVWVLRHVEGHGLDEIAALCRASKSTVQRRLRAAEAELRGRESDG